MENDKIYNDDCSITERIKTFEDACDKLGENDVLVAEYRSLVRDKITYSDDVIAYLKLRIICAALNEGWKPIFNGDELHYFPWFDIYTKKEYKELDEDKKKKCCTVGRSGSKANAYGSFVCESAIIMSSDLGTSRCYRLAFKTRKLAEYCGEQFIDIWADYLFS